jgi:hypothetical protein
VAATPGAVPHLIKFSGVINPKTNPQIAQTKENENLKSQSPAVVDVTFSLYQLQEGGSALWSESQQVQLDSQGRYSVLLGATLPEGLPLDLFTSGEALWLGVQAQAPGATEQPRVLLVAVPYALKAVDADTLGGKPASAYLSVDNPSATPPGAGLAAAASAAAGSGSGKGEAEKKQRSTSPSGSGTANYVPLWLDNNGTLGNSVFYQASNGNMGLGTTSPQQVLHVNGTSEILSTGTGAGFKFQMRDSKTTSVWYGTGNVSRFYRSDVGDILGITSNGNGTANVGIGTIAPAQVLHVNGVNEILSTGTGAGFKFQMRDGKTTSVWYGSGNVSRFWRSDYGDIIGITSAGSVGIGTTSPAALLEVNGPQWGTSVLAIGSLLGVSAAATATSGVTIGVSGVSNSSNGVGGQFGNTAAGGLVLQGVNGSNQQVFSVDNAGNVSATGTFTGNGAGLTNVGVLPDGFKGYFANGTFTARANITRLMVQMWGGGGGGGTVDCSGDPNGAGGTGGGGAWTNDLVTVVPGANYTIVVGAGGAAGGQGGDSQVKDPNSNILTFAGGGQPGSSDGTGGAGGQYDSQAAISHAGFSGDLQGFPYASNFAPSAPGGTNAVFYGIGVGGGGNDCSGGSQYSPATPGNPGYVVLTW